MEKQYEQARNQGLRIDPERVRLLSFRLLTIYLASKELKSLCDGEYDSGPDVLSQYEKPEIEHLLLQIAVLCRTADDNAIAGRTFFERYNSDVGKLYSDVSKPDFAKLCLREACNKIIHSGKVNYEVVEGEYEWNHYLEPTLYLYGTQNNIQWKAVLDIKKFCYSVCHVPE